MAPGHGLGVMCIRTIVIATPAADNRKGNVSYIGCLPVGMFGVDSRPTQQVGQSDARAIHKNMHTYALIQVHSDTSQVKSKRGVVPPLPRI